MVKGPERRRDAGPGGVDLGVPSGVGSAQADRRPGGASLDRPGPPPPHHYPCSDGRPKVTTGTSGRTPRASPDPSVTASGEAGVLRLRPPTWPAPPTAPPPPARAWLGWCWPHAGEC